MFDTSPADWNVSTQQASHPDPLDPFSNETEFRDYRSDYGYVLPEVRLPGCTLPLIPRSRERSRIRFYINLVGGFLAGHFVLTNALFIGCMLLYTTVQTFVDRSTAGTLPADYPELLEEYFMNSSSYLAMTMLIIGGCSLLCTLLGLRLTRVPVSTLFQTKDLTPGRLFGYVCIALCLQAVTGYAAYGFSVLFEGVGVTLYEADFSTTQDVKCIVLSFIYSVIVAPVTEELFMRGFIQKNLSRVSQRFGIVTTAFLFGIWHENLGQFLLAFAAGCFFGYIVARHNSLVPSIIVHMCVNLTAEAFTFCDTYGLDTVYTVLDWVYAGFVFIGAIVLLVTCIRERFPRTTPAQAERGTRMLLTSPVMLLAIVLHLGSAVIYIIQATQGDL